MTRRGRDSRHERSPWRWPLPALRKVRLRTWTVLAMIIFAVLGSVTAYRGAKTEQDTVVIAGKLAQGQLIEVGERQRLRIQTVSSAALWARQAAVRLEGRALMSSAAQARKEKRTEDAAWLAMRAHEEFAAARAIKLIRENLGPTRRSPDEENKLVAGTLAELGFGTFVHFQAAGSTARAKAEAASSHADACHRSNGVRLSQIWCETRERLEELHEHVRVSSLGVALFVLALTFFTVSDASVRTRWRRLKWGFFAVGLLMGAVAPAVVLIWGDTASWPYLLGGLVATPLVWLGLHYVVAYAEQKGWIHPEKREGSIHSEEVIFERAALRAPVLGHHLEHWFGVVTIVLIAVTVFVSAAVGWGYSVANTRADAAAEDARNSAAEMVIRTAEFSALQTDLAREVAAGIERRFRLGLANQRGQLSGSDESIKSRHDDEEARHSNALRTFRPQFDDINEVIDLKDLNVEDDPRFPNRLLWQFPRVPVIESRPQNEQERAGFENYERKKRSRNAYEAFALWDLESGESVAWRNVASSLLAGLMVFAIALYFLGQALAMEPTRSGYVLLAAGIAFVGVGVGSSMVSAYPMIGLANFAGTTPRAIEAVLSEYNCPAVYSVHDSPDRRRELAAYFYSVGTALGDNYSDDIDLERAQHYLGCAVALNEEFVLARLKLASVQSLLRSLDFIEPYTSLPERSKVRSRPELAEAQDLLQQSRLDLSAGQRNSLSFRVAFNGLIAQEEEALKLADKIAQEALDLVKGGKILARADTEGMLNFNLGFVRLARGQFDDGRRAYQAGREVGVDDDLRASALTDLEILWSLRCAGGKPPAGSTFDCPGLGSAITDIRQTVLVKKPDGNIPATVQPLPKGDFEARATANHLVVQVRGVDPAVDDLWLVWSRLEPDWGSWRTMQELSRPIAVPRQNDETTAMSSGTVRVERSYLRSYWGVKSCLTKGRYRVTLYSHGRQIAVRDDIVRSTPGMKPARFPELNLELCMPADWSVIPEQAAPTLQRSSYGIVRRVMNGAEMPAAFLFSFYVPTEADGLASCLVPGNDVRCAYRALVSLKMINGDEPLAAFEKMSDSLDRRALVYRTWTSQDGGVHVVLARADAGSREQLWDLLESAEVIYAENDIETTAQK